VLVSFGQAGSVPHGPAQSPLVQIRTMRAFLQHVVTFDEPQAIEAARLFNAVGRKRTLRVDALIASSAVVAGARLATNNREHFAAFAAYGLQLI
jgi:predicted nucleic acid-binding protein